MIDVPFFTPRWKKILLLGTILVSPFDNFLRGGKDKPMQKNLQKTRPLTNACTSDEKPTTRCN